MTLPPASASFAQAYGGRHLALIPAAQQSLFIYPLVSEASVHVLISRSLPARPSSGAASRQGLKQVRRRAQALLAANEKGSFRLRGAKSSLGINVAWALVNVADRLAPHWLVMRLGSRITEEERSLPLVQASQMHSASYFRF